jgi:elongation factor P
MNETSDFKKGLKILVEGSPYTIVDFQHVKPGKGNQFTRTKMKNLLTGQNLERTFKSGERFEEPNVMTRDASYLFKDESGFTFMDKENFEQYMMNVEDVGEASNFLTENLEVTVMFYNDRAIGVDLPKSVNLKVTRTDPGMRGNTVTGATKPATLETGFTVNVPLHISEGELLKIDTVEGSYLGRVND